MVSPLSLPFTARLYEGCDIFGYLCCLLYVSFESLDSWSWGDLVVKQILERDHRLS